MMANIASLRNEVEQHHFERSEKHHIAAGDASFDDIQGYVLIYLQKCGIIYLKNYVLKKSVPGAQNVY